MTLDVVFNEVNNAILDLQASDYNTYERPLKKLAKALQADELQEINAALRASTNLDEFLGAQERRGGMVGSDSLDWPDDKESELGLTLAIIEKAAGEPQWLLTFGHQWYYSGNKIAGDLRKVVAAVIIPFARDYRAYVSGKLATPAVRSAPLGNTKVFVVHGHDAGAKETIARFIEQQGLEAVILHEKASRGMSIPEKLAAHGDVGFAVILLTPDDFGRAAAETDEKPRARQNVILELGYFVGRLGRDRVCALLKGTVDLPTDYVGTVYVPLDDGGAWRMDLAKEMDAAGYDIDFNKVMRGR